MPRASASFTWLILLLAVSINFLQLYAGGARYWWDSIAYFQMARSIFSQEGLRSLFETRFGLVYQHVMPGLPMLIAAFETVFRDNLWIALALVQSLLAALAVTFLARSLDGILSRVSQVALVVFVGLHPWFAAFHANILTESLTATCVVTMAALAVRAIRGSGNTTVLLCLMLLLCVAGGQLRSYVAGAGGLLACLVIFARSRWTRPWLYALPVAAVITSHLAFSIYRAMIGIEFFAPNVKAWSLVYTSHAAWDFTARGRAALDGVVLNPELKEKLAGSHDNLSTPQMYQMVDDLQRAGYSRREAVDRIAGAAWVVRTQNVVTIGRQIQAALPSLGFQYLATSCGFERLLRQTDAAKWQNHLLFYYRWNSGLDERDYRKGFDDIVKLFRAQVGLYDEPVIDWYATRVKEHVKSQPNRLKSALGAMLRIPLDAFVVMGVLGFALLWRVDRRLGAILPLVALPVYAAALSATIVGDNRHAYPLFPLYVAGFLVVLDWSAYRIRERVIRP